MDKVKNLNLKFKNISREVGGAQNKHWLLLEDQYSTMTERQIQYGNVSDGAHRVYLGVKTNSSYGFFVIMGYDTTTFALIDSLYNDTWRLHKFETLAMTN